MNPVANDSMALIVSYIFAFSIMAWILHAIYIGFKYRTFRAFWCALYDKNYESYIREEEMKKRWWYKK